MITARRIENALLVLAGIIAWSDADAARKLAPIYDRIERELEALQRDDIRARALHRLAAATETRRMG